MNEKEKDQEAVVDAVNKEMNKISVIDSSKVDKITVGSQHVKELMKDPRFVNLKPCILFPDEEKMIVFDF